MLLRRALFYWQFISAFLLPAWVLVGRGILRAGEGWDFVLYLVLGPILCVVMLAVVGLTVARKQVRSTRAVSWLDAGVMAVWHTSIISYGFVASSALSAVIVVLSIIAFWVAVWQLYTETRTRVKNAFSLDPIDAGTYSAKTYDPATDAGRVIIINPDGTKEELPDR